MKPKTRTRFWFVCIMFILCGTATKGFAEENSGAVGDSNVLVKKTFTRWPDPVVLDCGLFSSILSKKVELIRMYSFSDGSFRPIPFQVDERDQKGNRVYPAGEHANPGDANGLLDKGEEMSFMARDCGDRVSENVFPQGIETWEELELVDPLTGGKGWVYLLYSSTNPPPDSKETTNLR